MLASDDPIYVDAHARFEASAGDSENMAIWKQNGPITIRTKKEADGTTTAIGEHARMDATPEEILPYFAEWADNCCEVNSNITAAAWVGKLDGVRVARWVGSAPFPLSSRVAYTRMYPDVGNMDDIRAYMTSQGTEAITAEAHFGAGEDATFALMDIKVAGWSVRPRDPRLSPPGRGRGGTRFWTRSTPGGRGHRFRRGRQRARWQRVLSLHRRRSSW